MYGKVNLLYVWRKNMNNVDDLRYKMFLKTYDVQSEKFFDIVKIFDASKSPPCKVELEQQVLRAAYVANIWQIPRTGTINVRMETLLREWTADIHVQLV